MKNKFYSFEKQEETADLYIFGDITSYEWDESDVSAFGFKQDLDKLGDISELNVHINSLGGSTYQGLAIYNILKNHKAKVKVFVDGIAASSASIIAMAGDEIYMPKTSLMMIHNCWTYVVGNANELRKTADDMDKIASAYKSAYLAKIKISEEKLNQLLEDETYLTADECVEMGFADKILNVEENVGINQYANMNILNLVNKAKEKSNTNNLTEGTLNNLLEKFSEKIENKFDKMLNEKINIFNNVNQDSWESFFNTKK